MSLIGMKPSSSKVPPLSIGGCRTALPRSSIRPPAAPSCWPSTTATSRVPRRVWNAWTSISSRSLPMPMRSCSLEAFYVPPSRPPSVAAWCSAPAGGRASLRNSPTSSWRSTSKTRCGSTRRPWPCRCSSAVNTRPSPSTTSPSWSTWAAVTGCRSWE